MSKVDDALTTARQTVENMLGGTDWSATDKTTAGLRKDSACTWWISYKGQLSGQVVFDLVSMSINARMIDESVMRKFPTIEDAVWYVMYGEEEESMEEVDESDDEVLVGAIESLTEQELCDMATFMLTHAANFSKYEVSEASLTSFMEKFGAVMAPIMDKQSDATLDALAG